MLNGKNRVFNPYFFNWYLSNEKSTFAENSMSEKISFSLAIFMGNPSLRSTVRGHSIKYVVNKFFI